MSLGVKTSQTPSARPQPAAGGPPARPGSYCFGFSRQRPARDRGPPSTQLKDPVGG